MHVRHLIHQRAIYLTKRILVLKPRLPRAWSHPPEQQAEQLTVMHKIRATTYRSIVEKGYADNKLAMKVGDG